MMNDLQQITRRHFLKECGLGFGTLAFGALWGCSPDKSNLVFDARNPLQPKPPLFAPKAKSVIYLHMAGAPSQLELFD
ncbi:MAG: twin-arginine translocation signal domain-containing protein, partial [Bacteroidota bacterium]